ncbi:hypothetical protein F511_23810 [Dorcoceras hygrometricum]|uniref:Uncharacterized protein n=1 Tax=Dorcoceras hygrometricum TaxID=472368 RepID=A0A2Z7ACJ0_9LAMI|nr:hypothetical protein F511_23810 [Dorcoceras hygrometricum]
MSCAMIKPAGSHSYLESAVARGQQAYYLKITSRSVVELEEKPAATQIQQRHEFSSWRLATQTSYSPRKFSTQSKILCTESFTMEIRKDSSRVQGRFRAVTIELRELTTDHATTEIPTAELPASLRIKTLLALLLPAINLTAETLLGSFLASKMQLLNSNSRSLNFTNQTSLQFLKI